MDKKEAGRQTEQKNTIKYMETEVHRSNKTNKNTS